MKYPTMKRSRWTLLLRGRLFGVAAPMLFLAVSAQAQPRITAASNPVVVPNGQASGTTTITWKAAPEYTYSEIYLSVDDAAWSEFAKGPDGSKTAILKLGSSYTFRMMIYEGQQGTPRIITTLTVTTVEGLTALPQPSGGGGSGDVATEANDRGSDYRVAPIRNVRVDPGPRHVFIRFQGPPNQQPYVAIGRGAAIKGADGQWTFGDNLVGGGFIGLGTVTEAEKAKGEYMFASAHGTTFSEDGLEPGRTYYYIITVPGNGRSYQDTGSFVMRRLTTTVKVVWERVLIRDDSDDLSTGEIQMWFWANFGQPSAKSSRYRNDDVDSGHTYNINKSIIIENAPNMLSLSASGRDEDAIDPVFDPERTPDPLDGPKDSSDVNVAKDTFDLTKYNDNEKVNFILNSMSGGSLQFVIYGRFEITRTTAMPGDSGNSVNIGTTSSALSTTLPPPRQFVGTFGTTPVNYQPMWVYAIKDDGDLLWYRKENGESAWQGPKKVGNGWAGYKDAIPAGGNSIYLLSEDGKLLWYRHDGFNDGAVNWKGPVNVGRGWTFARIFSGGEGIVYAIKDDGVLLWYRHGGYVDGGGLETWVGPKAVGRGWGNFKQVFSAGGGIIYAITQDGKLIWYKHNGYLTGTGLETSGAWADTKNVGRGWGDFKEVFSSGGGIIYAISQDGKLLWYKHNGYLTGAGLETPGAWEGPIEIGSGWLGFRKVFALIPVASSPIVR